MNDLKKIIAEAVKEIWEADRGDHGDDPTAEFIQAISPIIQATCEKALKHQGDDYATMDDARNRILDLERDLAACRRAAHASERWTRPSDETCAIYEGNRYIGEGKWLEDTKNIIDTHNASLQPVHASEPCASCKDARTIIERGIEIMSTEQVGKWTGVRSWLEQAPYHASELIDSLSKKGKTKMANTQTVNKTHSRRSLERLVRLPRGTRLKMSPEGLRHLGMRKASRNTGVLRGVSRTPNCITVLRDGVKQAESYYWRFWEEA